MAATVITAGLANPAKAVGASTTPVRASTSSTSRPTPSGGSRSLANNTSAPTTQPTTIQASGVIAPHRRPSGSRLRIRFDRSVHPDRADRSETDG